MRDPQTLREAEHKVWGKSSGFAGLNLLNLMAQIKWKVYFEVMLTWLVDITSKVVWGMMCLSIGVSPIQFVGLDRDSQYVRDLVKGFT